MFDGMVRGMLAQGQEPGAPADISYPPRISKSIPSILARKALASKLNRTIRRLDYE
jgi:hypothetical protein